jgi:CheY-like chemotaxis protein
MMFTLPDLVVREWGTAERPNLKILVVDDQETVRRALSLVFRRLDCGTEVAENGQEALRLLRQSHYDLVFMDLMMPVMDGLAATLQIRQERPDDAGPRIIGISADSTPGSRALCLSVGMDDFLAKPLEERELIRVLHESALERAAVECQVAFATWIVDATPKAAMSAADHVSIESVVVS